LALSELPTGVNTTSGDGEVPDPAQFSTEVFVLGNGAGIEMNHEWELVIQKDPSAPEDRKNWYCKKCKLKLQWFPEDGEELSQEIQDRLQAQNFRCSSRLMEQALD
jgi:hypothetical protein